MKLNSLKFLTAVLLLGFQTQLFAEVVKLNREFKQCHFTRNNIEIISLFTEVNETFFNHRVNLVLTSSLAPSEEIPFQNIVGLAGNLPIKKTNHSSVVYSAKGKFSCMGEYVAVFCKDDFYFEAGADGPEAVLASADIFRTMPDQLDDYFGSFLQNLTKLTSAYF